LNLFIHYTILIIRIHVRFIQKHHIVKKNVAKCARHIKKHKKDPKQYEWLEIFTFIPTFILCNMSLS